MRISTRSVLGIFLLWLFSTPLLFILFFNIKQQIIRERMKEELEEQMLQTISIKKKDVHWVKAGKEILVNGKMFDVESTKYNEDVITFTGLYDDAETLLVNLLNDVQNENSPADNKLLVQLVKCMHDVFYSSPAQTHAGPGKPLCFADLTSPPLPDQVKVIPSPPPQPGYRHEV